MKSGSKMENHMCPPGSGSEEQKGVVGTLGHLCKTEFFICLVSYKFAESSPLTLSKTPQAAGESGVCPLMLLNGLSGKHVYRGAPVIFQWMF